MAVFKCKMCGGSLEIKDGESTAVCEYCGTRQTLPRLDDERRANLYDRANHFRRNNEFDKAMSIYEQILNEDKTDAEAYWSIVLCRYGVEYVEDPTSHKRVPTVNRAQFTSIFMDEDYKSAIKEADGYQRDIYEAEARAIDEIQKGILAISKNEKPFDVFICYKETDNGGKRTPESVLATELYHELTKDGFKVFFSRITLEDKLGQEYEPYIFAAINSAKVMVVLGTKPEYLNAVWVKNEWSRYLSLIKNGADKTLIPAYKDMDPYDLPEEFSHLQAQDMSKLGFMQDLIRGVKKLAASEHEITPTVATASSGSGTNVAALLKRAFIFLEDGEWKSADEYCEKLLDIDPENAEAYVGKLMAEFHAKDRSGLADNAVPLENSKNYQKAMRFGDEKLKSELEDYYENIIQRNENTRLERIYKQAENRMTWCTDPLNTETYKNAAELFKSIPGYKDSDEKAEACLKKIEELKAEKKRHFEKFIHISAIVLSITCICIVFLFALYKSIIPLFIYNNAMECISNGQYNEGYLKLTELGDYKDSAEQIKISKYDRALIYIKNGRYNEGYSLLKGLGGYKNSLSILLDKYYGIYSNRISAGVFNTVCVISNNTTLITEYTGNEKIYYDQGNVSKWKNVVAVSARYNHTVGLKSDGTVVAVGDNSDGKCNVSNWSDIIAISAGYSHTVGVKADGTTVAVGDNEYGECNVSGWSDIVAVSTGNCSTFGLKLDGTVVTAGRNDCGQCDVSSWSNIVAVSAGAFNTIGLKSDGTVVATGENTNEQTDLSDWKDIVAVSAGGSHTVGLKSDGTVFAVGKSYTNNIMGDKYEDGRCNVSDWSDIVAVSAGPVHTVGLKSDGTVVSVGNNESGRCNVSSWDLF